MSNIWISTPPNTFGPYPPVEPQKLRASYAISRFDYGTQPPAESQKLQATYAITTLTNS